MADLSTITLPDNNTYNLRDNGMTYNRLIPLQSKTYTGVVAAANNDPNGWYYFGYIKPTSYQTPWKIRYRINGTIAGLSSNQNSFFEVLLTGVINTYYRYDIYNLSNSSYRSLYSHVLYTCTEAGITNGYGHLLGMRLQSAYNPTTAANSRTFVIDIIETVNCTFTFFDNFTLYANVPGTGSTNYVTRTTFDGTSSGHKMNGDNNTLDNQMIYFYGKTGASRGVWAGGLFMETEAGRYETICTASDGTATGSNRTTVNTKKKNPSGFKVNGTIYYTSTNYNANTIISGWGVVFSMYGNVFDSRYCLNTTLTAGSLTAGEPIYLVGTVSNGSFYLDDTWYTQTANTKGKVYVLIGYCFDSTASNCRISLLEHNPWYIYDGSKLVSYTYGYWQYNGNNDTVELIFPN